MSAERPIVRYFGGPWDGEEVGLWPDSQTEKDYTRQLHGGEYVWVARRMRWEWRFDPKEAR